MASVKYSQEHEWISVEGDVGTIGITHYAQEQLGDVVFVDVPKAGRKVAKGEACAVVESVKAASDIYAPASGEVIEANAAAQQIGLPVCVEVMLPEGCMSITSGLPATAASGRELEMPLPKQATSGTMP